MRMKKDSRCMISLNNYYLLFSAIFLLSVCTYNTGFSQEYHPKTQRITPAPRAAVMSPINKTLSNENTIKKYLTYDYSGNTPDIGSNGPQKQIIGIISDLKIKNHNIYILDNEFAQIKVFSEDGEYLRSIGKRGPGPGELSDPQDFTVTKDAIFVADGNRSIVKYQRVDNGYKLSYDNTIDHKPEGICTVDDKVYIYSRPSHGTGHIIHEYSGEGGRLTSFGSVYESNNFVLRSQISDPSDVECNDNNMFIQFRILPAIFKVDLHSKKVTWASVLNHKTIRMESLNRSGRPAVRKLRPTIGTHFGSELAVNDSLAVASYRVRRRSKTDVYHAYVLDANNGAFKSLGENEVLLFDLNNDLITVKPKGVEPKVTIIKNNNSEN